MRTIDTPSKWRPWQGVILQIAALVMLLTAGRFLQMQFGFTGLILSETLFLILAVVYTLIRRTPLKEVFPVHKISVRDFFGTEFLWMGSIMFGFISIYLSAVLLPDIFTKVLSSLNSTLSGASPLITFLTVAVLAPICEESIERGAVLSHFRGLKKEWAIMLIIGVFFGIMHTDPIRFMNTTIMGASCAYLMIKKDNILLPVLFHFTNNSVSTLISSLSSKMVDPELTDKAVQQFTSSSNTMILSLASSMIMFSAAPVFIALGAHLLMPKLTPDTKPDERKARSKKIQRNYIVGTCAFGILLISGFAIMLFASSNIKLSLS